MVNVQNPVKVLDSFICKSTSSSNGVYYKKTGGSNGKIAPWKYKIEFRNGQHLEL